jgi:uncharacterized damage-inducible protein DinB
MATPDPMTVLRSYLQDGRDALLWKLEGLSEYDVRRPLTPTGTNLLGLVKHVSGDEIGYFGDTFGRPYSGPVPPGLIDTGEPNTDMWATPDESREMITSLYRHVWAHSNATFDALELDAPGHVEWWGPERGEVTLQQVLAHMIAETHRHAGHADIVRELIDGSAGLRAANPNLPVSAGPSWWAEYRDKVERAAKQAHRD